MGTLLVAQGASTSGARGAAGVAAAPVSIALFLRNGAVAGRGLEPVAARRRLVVSASRLVHFKKEVKSACALTLETPHVGMPCAPAVFRCRPLLPRFHANFLRELFGQRIGKTCVLSGLSPSRRGSSAAGEVPVTG